MSSSICYQIAYTVFLLTCCLVNCYSIPLDRNQPDNNKYSICIINLKPTGLLACHLNVVSGNAAKINRCIKESSITTPNRLISCEFLTTNYNICTVSIELDQLVTIKPFYNGSCSRVSYTVTLTSIAFNESNYATPIMEDPQDMHQANILNSHFDAGLGRMLSTKFRSARTINMTSIRTNLPLTSNSINYTIFPYLQDFSISSSLIGSMERRAIVLGQHLSSLVISDVQVERYINSGTIVLENLNCSNHYRIELRDLNIQNEMVERDFIKFQPDNLNRCPNPIHISLIVEGNSFDKILHEHMFRTVLEKAYNTPQILFNFSTYEIECCLPLNRWMFNLSNQDSSKTKNVIFQIECVDLGENFADYRNQTELDEVCYSRNVSPILIMAIVASLVLASLLAIFTLICIYYVIPKKNQEIMISRQSSLQPLSKMKAPATKASNPSVISHKTAGTQMLGTQLPLLSDASFLESGPKKEAVVIHKTLESSQVPRSLEELVSKKQPVQSATKKATSLLKTSEPMKKSLKVSFSDIKNTFGKKTSKGSHKHQLSTEKVVKNAHVSSKSSHQGIKNHSAKSSSLIHKKGKHQNKASLGEKPKGTKARHKTISAKKMLNLPTVGGQRKRSTGANASRESMVKKHPSKGLEKPDPAKELLTNIKTTKSNASKSAQDIVSPTSPQPHPKELATKETKDTETLNKSLDEGMSMAFNTVNG